MANFFKGFKQVTLDQYNLVPEAERLNYMWLVRDKSADSDVVKSSAIYFGNRKYAEINNSNEELVTKLNGIVSALGMTVGEDGTFNKYLPIAEDPILSGETITNVSEALKALSAAITNAKSIADAATKTAEAAKTEAANATAAADRANTKAEAAEATAATATETANAAKDTATKANEAAATATNTANSALEKAEEASTSATNATETANSAKTTADEAKAATEGLKTTVDGISGKVATLETNSATKTELHDEVEKLTASIDGKTLTAGNDIKINDEGKSINVSLAEEITVAGLNDTYGCGLIKNGNTIPAGTSLTEILKQMLSKEINPSAATKPTIGITKDGPVSGLHEIGEVVNVGTATIIKTSGKFNNNGWTSPSQPAAVFTWSGEKMSSKLVSGAEGYEAQTDAASIAQGTATTVKGTNKVTISASANYSAPTNKPVTNLNKAYDGAEATWADGVATNSTSIEWTGVYPCFANTKSLGKEPNEKLALQTSATFRISVAAHNAGGNDFRFAYPDGWTISSFKVKSLDGNYYEFAATHNKNAGDISKTIQNNAVTYHYLTVENGASDYEITLDKGLNA